jgi:hypothetical protein
MQTIESTLRRFAAPGYADRIAIVTLVLLCLWSFRRLLLLGERWLNGDLILANQAWAEWQAAHLREGTFPLWTSDILGGFPIAFSEYPWFYPLHWPFLVLLPAPSGYAAAMIAHLCLGVLCIYAFVRLLGVRPVAAFLAGVVFALNTFMLGTVHFNNFSPLFALLPVALLGVQGLCNQRRWGWPVLSFSIALALLGGHPQLFGYLFLLPGIYALTHLIAALRHSRKRGAVLALSLVTALASGAAVSLVRWLPTLELVAASARGDAGAAGGVSVPPWSFLLGFVFLDFHIPRLFTAQGLLFVGALPVFLAVVGALAWRSSLPVRAFVITLAAAALFALGNYTPFFGLLQLVPGISFFRDPHRAVATVNVCVALLAAFGLQRLLADRDVLAGRTVRYAQRLFIVLAALLAIGGIIATLAFRLFGNRITEAGRAYVDQFVLTDSTKQQEPAFYYGAIAREIEAVGRSLRLDEPLVPFYAVALLGAGLALLWLRRQQNYLAPIFFMLVVATGTLLVGNRNLVPSAPLSLIEKTPAAVEFVQADGVEGRIFGWRLGGVRHEIENAQSQDPRGEDSLALQYLTPMAALAPNRNLTYGIPSLDGYENLMTSAQDRVLGYVGSERAITPGFAQDPNSDATAKREIFLSRLPVLARLGVSYVTSLELLESPQLTPLGHDTFQLTGGAINVYAYKLLEAERPVFLADDYVIADTVAEALPLLEANRLVLEREPNLTPGSLLTSASSTAQIVELSSGYAEIAVNADGAGVLVWLQAPLAGWSALVDGQPEEILSANVLGMAVPIDATTERVVFRYTPPGFALGLRLTALGILALILGTIIHVWHLRPQAQSTRQEMSSNGNM